MYPPHLSGSEVGSFAYLTIRDRLPIIISKIVDHLSRFKKKIINKYGEVARGDILFITNQLTQLRNELLTNKPITPLDTNTMDSHIWNTCVEMNKVDCNSKKLALWFHSSWLFVECYMYRRIWECFLNSLYLKNYDYFGEQKEKSFLSSLTAVQVLSQYIHDISMHDNQKNLKNNVYNLLKICLWSNKIDLSISGGEISSQVNSPVDQISNWNHRILADDFEQTWEYMLTYKHDEFVIGYILDNAGYELFADFCFADYLINQKLVCNINFYVKNYPWFVSDCTRQDVFWMLDFLEENCQPHFESTADSAISFFSNSCLKSLVKRWKNYIYSGIWKIHDDSFWTYPYSFCDMLHIDSKLYTNLSMCKLLIFKGDLNYRKLVSDLKWPITTSFESSLLGFHPAPLVVFRTLKAEVVVGLNENQIDMTKLDKNWMTSGNYGVIQFCNKVKN